MANSSILAPGVAFLLYALGCYQITLYEEVWKAVSCACDICLEGAFEGVMAHTDMLLHLLSLS